MDVTTLFLLAAVFAVGVALGLALAKVRAGEHAAALEARLDAERVAAAERVALLERAQVDLTERFRAMSAEALEHNNAAFLRLADARLREAGARAAGDLDQRRQAVEHLVAPLREALARVESQLRELEQARVSAHGALVEQVRVVRETGERLRTETAALVSALSKPQVRGRWGEVQLRRVVELAGMLERCDFETQASVTTDDGVQRPDLVVRLAGGKSIVVDAKVSLAAYLEAAESLGDTHRERRLAAHARHLRDHVDALAAKAYWQQFTPAPEFVVLFVPGEAFLAPALEHDPALLEHAFSRRVHIATPTTLVSLLRTAAYAWQQDALTDNARAVFDLGRELYARLGKLGEHVDRLGRALGGTVSAYNAAVGSLEGRVLVTARRLRDLHVVEADLDVPSRLEASPRSLTAEELAASAEQARAVVALPSRGDVAPTTQALDA